MSKDTAVLCAEIREEIKQYESALESIKLSGNDYYVLDCENTIEHLKHELDEFCQGC
jgi:hypothetical protein